MGFFFHYPLVVDYHLATKNIQTIPEDIKQNPDHKLTNWDITKSTLPTIETPADLLIYRDSSELKILDLQIFLKDIANNIKEGGFLFAMFRSQLTEAEIFLNNILG